MHVNDLNQTDVNVFVKIISIFCKVAGKCLLQYKRISFENFLRMQGHPMPILIGCFLFAIFL